MKYKPHIVQNPDGGYSSEFYLANSASSNETMTLKRYFEKYPQRCQILE